MFVRGRSLTNSSVVPETVKAADFPRVRVPVGRRRERTRSSGLRPGPGGQHGRQRAGAGQEGEFTHPSVASAPRPSRHARLARARTHAAPGLGPGSFRGVTSHRNYQHVRALPLLVLEHKLRRTDLKLDSGVVRDIRERHAPVVTLIRSSSRPTVEGAAPATAPVLLF